MADVAAPAAAPAAPAPTQAAPIADPKAAATPPKADAKAPPAPGKADPKALAKVDAAVVKEVQKQIHKLVVDGKEEEVDVDELIRRAQLSTAADKRFREASKLNQEAKERDDKFSTVLNLMKNDPAGFAKEAKAYGLNPEDFAVKVLEPILREQIEAAEEAAMSPEQKKQRELEKRVQEYERQEQDRKIAAEKDTKDKAEAAEKAEIAKLKDEYAGTLMEALKQTKLPQTPETALALSELMQEVIDRGLPLKPEQLAKDLEARKRAELSALLKASGSAEWLDEDYRKMIRQEAINDPEISEAVRKKAVQEYKKANPLAAGTKATTAPPKESGKTIARRTMGSIMRDLQLKKL